MKVDLYTKTVLTVIALALSLFALNPWITPRPAIGSPDIVNYLNKIAGEIHNVSREVCKLRETSLCF